MQGARIESLVEELRSHVLSKKQSSVCLEYRILKVMGDGAGKVLGHQSAKGQAQMCKLS